MTANDAIKALKERITNNIASKIKLPADNKEGQYVNPYVEVLHIPHANFRPQGFSVPFILIELLKAKDDIDIHELEMKLTIATYGGEYYKNASGNSTNIPDSTGYIDLIAVIEAIKQELLSDTYIDGKCIVKKPIEYGTYDTEMVYPYWYGYMIFKMEMPTTSELKGFKEGYL